MRLQDILDMKEYLRDRAYCENEIYDLSGFLFDCFPPETECEFITECENVKFVFATGIHNPSLQILVIAHNGESVTDCFRVDATTHNIEEVYKFADGEIHSMSFDEYWKGKADAAIKEVLEICDGVMV